MKILYVHGDGDYAALHFEENHGGVKVSEIIRNVEKYKDADYILEVLTFAGNVDANFVDFVRSTFQDYDASKHSTFYTEDEVV